MSKFDFLDDVLYHAKNAADAASKKTGDVMESGKLRYHIKQTNWELDKAYAKLGAIVYEAKKSEEDFEDVIALATTEIDDLSDRLEILENRLCEFKRVVKCQNCGKENERGAVFCNRCGSTFTINAETVPPEENLEDEDEDDVSEE